MDKTLLAGYADSLRGDLNYPIDAPISIHILLKKKNIQAYFHPLDENLLGMAVKQVDEKKSQIRLFMMINTLHTYVTQRFTACHELYHLLFQESKSCSFEDFKDAVADDEESNANYFADCLMLPEKGLRKYCEGRHFEKLGIAEILALEHDFRCGHKLATRRLKELGLIDDYFAGELLTLDIVAIAKEYGYPTDLYRSTKKVELVSDYNFMARQLFERGIISQAKYLSILRDMNIEKEDGEE